MVWYILIEKIGDMFLDFGFVVVFILLCKCECICWEVCEFVLVRVFVGVGEVEFVEMVEYLWVEG